jgi:hypothetical protein
MKSIDLLNSRGPILRAIKYNSDRFDIIDRYNYLVDILDAEEIKAFIHGKKVIIDSKNKAFDFTLYPEAMKPDIKVLNKFIEID